MTVAATATGGGGSRHLRRTALDLVAALGRHDPVTGAHLRRLPLYTALLTDELAAHPRHRVALQPHRALLPLASTLHDVGKLHIPERILRKRGPLSAEEFVLMKRHTMHGRQALQELVRQDPDDAFLALGADIALYHHERWDGSGYPFGLRGPHIPLVARIVALADVYDALTSERPYKPAFDHDVARTLIRTQCGAHFDADVVEAFLVREPEFARTSHQPVDTGAPLPLPAV